MDGYADPYNVWNHPLLTGEELKALVRECYTRFYSLGQWYRDFPTTLYSRVQVFRGRHPLSGGLFPVRLDNTREYRAFRKEIFEIDTVPLPDQLK